MHLQIFPEINYPALKSLKTLLDRSFSVAAPKLCNELPSEIIIIHVGTNSLRNSNSSRECADEIVDIGRMVDHEGISVAISSLTARADDNELDKRVKEVNKILKRFCRQNKWGFIDHNIITTDQHLNRSRLHLNRSGTSLLSQNFISSLLELPIVLRETERGDNLGTRLCVDRRTTQSGKNNLILDHKTLNFKHNSQLWTPLKNPSPIQK